MTGDQFDPRKPFRRADLPAGSMSEWQLRRMHRVVFHGVRIHKDVELTPAVLAGAALLAAPAQSYVSHHTAAVLWGGVVPEHPGVHVTSPSWRCKVAGICAHRGKAGQAVTLHRGIRLTTPVQTFVDLAQALDLVDLVVLGDSLAGLPEPTVDHRIYDKAGALLYRFDLAYLGWGLIIEYDGWQHAGDQDQWETDVRRDEQLDNWKIRRVVVLSKHLYNTPAETLSRIITAMRAQGMTIPPLSAEWRRHFPSKPWDLAAAA